MTDNDHRDVTYLPGNSEASGEGDMLDPSKMGSSYLAHLELRSWLHPVFSSPTARDRQFSSRLTEAIVTATTISDNQPDAWLARLAIAVQAVDETVPDDLPDELKKKFLEAESLIRASDQQLALMALRKIYRLTRKSRSAAEKAAATLGSDYIATRRVN